MSERDYNLMKPSITKAGVAAIITILVAGVAGGFFMGDWYGRDQMRPDIGTRLNLEIASSFYVREWNGTAMSAQDTSYQVEKVEILGYTISNQVYDECVAHLVSNGGRLRWDNATATTFDITGRFDHRVSWNVHVITNMTKGGRGPHVHFGESAAAFTMGLRVSSGNTTRETGQLTTSAMESVFPFFESWSSPGIANMSGFFTGRQAWTLNGVVFDTMNANNHTVHGTYYSGFDAIPFQLKTTGII